MNEKKVIICDFEIVDCGERHIAYPVGLAGATEGYNQNDALEMAYDWLKETAISAMLSGQSLPEHPLGTNPIHGGKMFTIATEVGIEDAESISASEAAELLGVSQPRIQQMCNDGTLASWQVGSARRISLESAEILRMKRGNAKDSKVLA